MQRKFIYFAANPVDNYMSKANNRNTKTRCEQFILVSLLLTLRR